MSEIASVFPAHRPDGSERTGSGKTFEGVALVTIDRAAVLNTLDAATMTELVGTLERLDADESCRAIVITGAGERAFAAGADIKEMAGFDARSARESGNFERWDAVADIATPTVAAVRGFILGGGLELAMACDIIIAADDATFGQPEVLLGIIPGAGGTQRLTRAIGKARAMELILSGRRFSATEAAAFGLVSRLERAERVVSASLELAAEIAAQAPLAVRAAKAAIDLAAETALTEGVAAERAAFTELFDTEDQDEGMSAFIEKRRPEWKGR
jgi:enoyl-CoA hydratase/carnithine racemase